MQSTYNTGKEALLKHRAGGKSATDEFTAVSEACREDWFGSIWSGLWWPATLTSRATPNLVMWLNPASDEVAVPRERSGPA